MTITRSMASRSHPPTITVGKSSKKAPETPKPQPLPNFPSIPSTDTITTKATHAGHSTTKFIYHIAHFDELPPWMQSDPYIRHGYRRQLDSFRECFHSLLYPHNEFVNTWSHMLPGFFFLALLAVADYSVFHAGGAKTSKADNLAIQTYIAGTAGCLLLSAFFHCTSAHSEDVVRRYLKFDYLGITLSISTTSISAMYFGLYGNTQLPTLYISLTVLCAIAVFVAVLDPNMDGSNAAAWRASVFIALGGSGFAPIIHVAIVEGAEGLRRFPLINITITCLSYLVGTTIYVGHVPEKYCPGGMFDIWGSSHQIFHLLVVFGQIVHLMGLRNALLMHYP